MAGSPTIDYSKIPDFDKDFVNDDGMYLGTPLGTIISGGS